MKMGGAFRGTRVMEIVKKHDSRGLVWKRIKLTTTRKLNAKKRIQHVWQVGLSFFLSILPVNLFLMHLNFLFLSLNMFHSCVLTSQPA
ncbi:hypothetical protein Hdeb2414_s0022g00609911 [Helianthus debilis subsp. tardiflorus]